MLTYYEVAFKQPFHPVDKDCEAEYIVVATGEALDGEIHETVFYGPRGEARAKEYATFKNAQMMGLGTYSSTSSMQGKQR